jgi:hypothetical protein
MTLKDLHGPFYLASERELCRDVKSGQTIQVPLYASFLTDDVVGSKLVINADLYGWDAFGHRKTYSSQHVTIAYTPWMCRELAPLEITVPNNPTVAVLALKLEDLSGNVLHRNFTTYLVSDGPLARHEIITSGSRAKHVLRFAPETFQKAEWSLKQWNVMNGLKVNGAGSGYFEYHLPWPTDLQADDIAQACLIMELSAKRLNGKDREGAAEMSGDFMLGQGTNNPSRSPNSYPMTDNTRFPSAVRIHIGDTVATVIDLPNDPADHRGILSWHSQIRDYNQYPQTTSFRPFKGGELQEAGSYGYLTNTRIPLHALHQARAEGKIRIRLEVNNSLPGGLAIYGERFGRYLLDPTLIFVCKGNAKSTARLAAHR